MHELIFLFFSSWWSAPIGQGSSFLLVFCPPNNFLRDARHPWLIQKLSDRGTRSLDWLLQSSPSKNWGLWFYAVTHFRVESFLLGFSRFFKQAVSLKKETAMPGFDPLTFSMDRLSWYWRSNQLSHHGSVKIIFYIFFLLVDFITYKISGKNYTLTRPGWISLTHFHSTPSSSTLRKDHMHPF